MKKLSTRKIKNSTLKFYYTDYGDYVNLSEAEKAKLECSIQRILESVSYKTRQVTRCPNDILLLCDNGVEIVGFMHIVPEKFNYENEPDRFDARKMYVDYIAVQSNFQGLGIASKLYNLSVAELAKSNTQKLSAILFDEYSRKAFFKTMQKNGVPIEENLFDGSVTANIKQKAKNNVIIAEK